MRFIENSLESKKEPKPKKKETSPVKAGNKDYDYTNLEETKKILTGRGSI